MKEITQDNLEMVACPTVDLNGSASAVLNIVPDGNIATYLDGHTRNVKHNFMLNQLGIR